MKPFDPIVMNRNDDNATIPITGELKQVINSVVQLENIPHRFNPITVKSEDNKTIYTEIFENEELTNTTFKCNYSNGRLYFNPSQEGKIVKIDYSSIGYFMISTDRIYYDKRDNGSYITLTEITYDAENKESIRVNSENIRNTSENQRISSENLRKSQETQRVNAENTRDSAESTRISQENTRKSNETSRQSNETQRISQEQTRQSNESLRVNAEQVRNMAEDGRIARANQFDLLVTQLEDTVTHEVFSNTEEVHVEPSYLINDLNLKFSNIINYIPITEVSNTFTIDISQKQNFTMNIGNTNNKTITFINAPTNQNVIITISLKLNFTQKANVNFPSGTIWQDSIVPIFESGKQYIICMLSYDNGVTWLASFVGAWW